MDKKAQVEQLTTYMANFVSYIGKVLPDDIKAKIDELAEKEDSPLSKVIYETMKKKSGSCQRAEPSSCQDTGVLQFWVKCGTNFPLIGELEALLKEAVVKATLKPHSAITVLRHLTNTIPERTSEKVLLLYSGILYRTVTSVKSIHTWQAADVHFLVKQWFSCRGKVMKVSQNLFSM